MAVTLLAASIQIAQASDSDAKDAANGMAGVTTARGGFFSPAGLIIDIDGLPPPGTDSTFLREMFAIRGLEHYSIMPGTHVFTLLTSFYKLTVYSHVRVTMLPGHTYRFVGYPVKFQDTTNGNDRYIPLFHMEDPAGAVSGPYPPYTPPPAVLPPPPSASAEPPMTYDQYLRLHPEIVAKAGDQN